MNAQEVINALVKNGQTMVSERRMNHLLSWVEKFHNCDYSFVECGVAKGGCIALMRCFSEGNRIFGFDSFEGMPNLTEKDEDNALAKQWVGVKCSGVGIDAVYATFRSLNLDFKNVFIVKGYFEETLKLYLDNIGEIAILRLDNDWYESTRYCLEMLYDSVIPGGVILIDDYGTFPGCRNAVNEFREEQSISSPLIECEANTEWFWIK